MSVVIVIVESCCLQLLQQFLNTNITKTTIFKIDNTQCIFTLICFLVSIFLEQQHVFNEKLNGPSQTADNWYTK